MKKSTENIDIIDIFVDGSAVDCMRPVSLGAGWVAVKDKKPLAGASERIETHAPNKSYALYAELCAATYALRKMHLDYGLAAIFRLNSDRREIIDCVNNREVPRQVVISQPEMVFEFEQLLNFLDRLEISARRSQGSRFQNKDAMRKLSPAFPQLAHDAAHVLAAQASGSRKVIAYPRLHQFLEHLSR